MFIRLLFCNVFGTVYLLYFFFVTLPTIYARNFSISLLLVLFGFVWLFWPSHVVSANTLVSEHDVESQNCRTLADFHGKFKISKTERNFRMFVLVQWIILVHFFNWINQQDAATSQVYYLSFKYSSTCFGHPHAHHQKLLQLLSSRRWAWGCPKYVELYLNDK